MVRTLVFCCSSRGPRFAAGAASMRLYVTNSLGGDVSVIDLATLKPVRTLKMGEHVHGITNVVPGTGYEAMMRAPEVAAWERCSREPGS